MERKAYTREFRGTAVRLALRPNVSVEKVANASPVGGSGAVAELFQFTEQHISLHVQNVPDDGEFPGDSVCKDYLQTAADEVIRLQALRVRHDHRSGVSGAVGAGRRWLSDEAAGLDGRDGGRIGCTPSGCGEFLEAFRGWRSRTRFDPRLRTGSPFGLEGKGDSFWLLRA